MMPSHTHKASFVGDLSISLKSFSKQLELETLNHQCELERLKNDHTREILALEIEFHSLLESERALHTLEVQTLRN